LLEQQRRELRLREELEAQDPELVRQKKEREVIEKLARMEQKLAKLTS